MSSLLGSFFGRLSAAADAFASGGNRTPPRYGTFGGSTLAGRGYAPPPTVRDYEREAGRLDHNGVVRLCLRWYADAIGQVAWRVGTKANSGPDKGEWQVNETHEVNRLLRRPCPIFSHRELWSKVASGYLIDGNAYLVIVRSNAGFPVQLWWVPNWQVEVIASGDAVRPVAYYRVSALDGGWMDYDPADVVHIRDHIDDENPLVGQGVLKSFLADILGHRRGAEYTEATLRKSNAGLVLMPPKGDGGMSYAMTSVEESEMLGHRRRLARGLDRGNDEGVIALTSYLEHAKVGFSPEEMALDRILDRPEAYICAAMGLSPLLLDLPSSRDSKTYANKAEARKGAWEDSALPMFGVFAEAIRDQVLYRVDPDTGEEIGQYGDAPGLEVWPDTSEVPALQDNQQEKADYWVGLVDAGMVKREYAASQLDIPEEAIPEEPEPFEPTPEEMQDGEQDGDEEDDDEEEEDEEDDPEPEPDDDATKARRPRGGSSASKTPPNVSRAAARVAKGEGTSADQKLLRAWEKRKKGDALAKEKVPGPTEAQYERAAARAATAAGRKDRKTGEPGEAAALGVQNQVVTLRDAGQARVQSRFDRDDAFAAKLERWGERKAKAEGKDPAKATWEDYLPITLERRAARELGRRTRAKAPDAAGNPKLHAAIRKFEQDDLDPGSRDLLIRSLAGGKRAPKAASSDQYESLDEFFGDIGRGRGGDR